MRRRKATGVERSLPNTQTVLDWVKGSRTAVVFDSDRDGMERSSFVASVVGRSNVMLVVFDDAGNVFGAFAKSLVKRAGKWVKDKGWFVCSFASRGVPVQPQRWARKRDDVTDPKRAFLLNDDPASGNWVSVGDFPCGIRIGSHNWNHCRSLSLLFDGIGDLTLSGNTFPTPFVLRRLIVVCCE